MTNTLSTPWLQPWPANGLERAECCPVCSEADRVTLHSDLIDNAFRAARGKWTLWQCANCRSAYLDPRPTPETIHLAYESYYTHQESRGRDDYATLSPLRKLRRRMTNAYTNWRYSTNELPALALGIPLMLLLWPQRHRLASEYRHMPKRPATGGTLLDVGCGSGSFLRTAKSCGWKVTGIDPDPKAAMACSRQGLDVLQGGIEQFAGMESLFDVITLNHVIEHVHDPVSTLAACHRLLKPDGQLWLATPNIDSLGHQQYGRNWRGLEPPRHLALFNAASLRIALERAGFRKTVLLPGSSPLLSMTQASEKIKRGIPIEDDLPLTAVQNWAVAKGRLRQALSSRSREFLTVAAFKAERK